MVVGVQIADTMPPNATIDYFTWGWDPSLDVVWTVVPTTQSAGQPQVEWHVAIERASDTSVTYHVTITNLTAGDLGVEGRYAILNL
jgi:hypothetical protein